MISVWKCDHCCEVNVDPIKIQQHEPKCSFNKVNKKCYTCKYSYEGGYYGDHFPGCEINLDVIEGEEHGNCTGWIYEYLDKERDEKLSKLI